MSDASNNLQEDVRFRLLRLLQDNPELSQRQLAQAVGISVGGVHYVLKALIDEGWVKLGNFTASKDKRRYAYVLTPKGLSVRAALAKRFLRRKTAEFEALKMEIAALQAELGLGEDRGSPPSRKSGPRSHSGACGDGNPS